MTDRKKTLKPRDIEILELINKWGYLDNYQIALLTKQAYANVGNRVRRLSFLNYLTTSTIQWKTIWKLTTKGFSFIESTRKKPLSDNIALQEYKHRSLMVNYVASNNLTIREYFTDREISLNPSIIDNHPFIPDIYYERDGIKHWVEVERTIKDKKRLIDKAQDMIEIYKDKKSIVIWYSDSEIVLRKVKEALASESYVELEKVKFDVTSRESYKETWAKVGVKK